MNPTIGVCGFGRCGTTAVMTMLDAGGIDPVPGTQPVSYELESIAAIGELTTADLTGRAVKLLDAASIMPLPPAPAWQFIWLDRDPIQQARSQAKLLTTLAGIDAAAIDIERLAAGNRHARPARLAQLRHLGPVLVIDYERLLANPRRIARNLAKFAPSFDVDAATAAVHHRSPACRPDLAFETSETAELLATRTTRHVPTADGDEMMPVLPGIIPDLTQASQDMAMRQAHEDLPNIPGTRVHILIAALDDGYRLLLDAGWTEAQVDQLRAHAATVAGDDPHMAIAMRRPA